MRSCVRRLLLVLLLIPGLPVAAAPVKALPWEYWRDPSVLPRIPDGMEALLSSSHSEAQGAFDRHSEGDSRFIRIVDGEGVIFETEGAGVLTRIWATQGDGMARELDESIRLRIRINGNPKPLIDESLKDFFSGRKKYRAPVVQNFHRHGGGNVSRLPIGFRSGCRVSLMGAEKAKIWFQVNAIRWDGAADFPLRDPREEAAALGKMLKLAGSDPWPKGHYQSLHGRVLLHVGESREVARIEGPGQLNALLLDLPPRRWPDVELALEFDGRETVRMSLPWFFGVGGPGCDPPKSLWIGGSGEVLYSYFPMPFRQRARIFLRLLSGSPVRGEFSLRSSANPLEKDVGVFEARRIDKMEVQSGGAAEILRIDGANRLAGLFLSVAGPGGSWAVLEGDETFLLNGERVASWHGTGVEDFFGGGFYFRGPSGQPTQFFGPLSGVSCLRLKAPEFISMYRMMSAEGPISSRGLSMFWEGGPRDQLAVRWRGVAWLYHRQQEEGAKAENSQ